MRYLIEGDDLSLYGLSNAVPRTSQDIDSYNRATELEGICWKMAAMKDAEWEGLNTVLPSSPLRNINIMLQTSVQSKPESSPF